MAQLSRNFSSEEFSCRCGCGQSDVSPRLVAGLQTLRDAVQRPVMILSGRRCTKHNKSVGGAKNSFHLTGQAADILVVGLTPTQLLHTARDIPEFRGFGLGATFLHVDVRAKLATWKYDSSGKAIAA